MNAWSALLVVLAVAAIGYAGTAIDGLKWAFAVLAPYVAIALFLGGLAWRVVRWALAPVPFRIPTTCGQQRSLAWIKPSRLDNPFTAAGAAGRVALEVLLFRSLFRNTKAQLEQGPRLFYAEDRLLWLGALAFHWSFLIIFLRHLRLFLEPVPGFVQALQNADGFFQLGEPAVYASDAVMLAALGYLLLRRLVVPQVRYISLFTDYAALYLLLALGITGVVMRYFTRTDVVAVKQFALGLVTFSPMVPESAGRLFFLHLFLLSTLLAYFPFSKLVHMAGVFLSPTRNLANNNRMERHRNPWNYPVKVHTYEEWEQEFHDKIVAAGLPLDKG